MTIDIIYNVSVNSNVEKVTIYNAFTVVIANDVVLP